MNIAQKAAVAVTIAGAAAGVGAGVAAADSDAYGVTAKSPGVASGNLGQVPVHVPVDAVGNTANLIGLLNPSFGNTGVND